MSSPSLEQKYQQSLAENSVLREENASLQRQLDWFKRQLFGRKSERLLAIDPAVQQSLLGSMQDLPAPPPPEPDEDASPAKTPSRKTRRDAVNDTGRAPGKAWSLGEPHREAWPKQRIETQWVQVPPGQG